MNLTEIKARMAEVKQRAGFFVNQRRKDGELYEMLAETLAICETVATTDGMEDALREDIAARERNGRNRVYTERQSDVFVVVGRFVFEPEINRAASWRYSATLREAAKRGLTSRDLPLWLREHGGINALFRGRPVKARTSRTKTLHLNTQIEVSKDHAFTLTLRRDARGFFDVIHEPTCASPAGTR